MRRKRFKITVFLLFAFGLANMQAQESVNASGGNATGSGGQQSYSVGQVNYTAQTNASGSVSQGVQQLFEISVFNGYEEVQGVKLSCSVYPNPSIDFLTLKIDESQNPDIQSMSFQLNDINGKRMAGKNLAGNETSIDMGKFIPATYFLKILKDNTTVKTFKIIKNQAK